MRFFPCFAPSNVLNESVDCYDVFALQTLIACSLRDDWQSLVGYGCSDELIANVEKAVCEMIELSQHEGALLFDENAIKFAKSNLHTYLLEQLCSLARCIESGQANAFELERDAVKKAVALSKRFANKRQ